MTVAATYASYLNRETPMPGEELPLAVWRERSAHPALTVAEMEQVVDRAIATLSGLYVHQELKRTLRKAHPIAELQDLRGRVAGLSKRAFHDEMLRIYKSLGDVHTAYRLPKPFRDTIAFLPFLLKACSEGGRRKYVVARTIGAVPIGFERGVEVVSWNGVRMDEAVTRSTELEEGSTESHDLALGLQSMTVRWLGASYEPDTPSVTVGYKVAGEPAVRDAEFAWSVFEDSEGPRVIAVNQAVARVFDRCSPRRAREQAVNIGSRVVQSFRRKLYAPDEDLASDYPALIDVARKLRVLFGRNVGRRELKEFTGLHPALSARGDVVPSLLPAYLEASVHDGSDLLAQAGQGSNRPLPADTESGAVSARRFGYLRIRAFPLEDPEAGLFKYELRRLLNLLPAMGLIVDVRDNPGGSTRNAEESLQFFTPHRITPVPFRFRASPMTAALAAKSVFAEYAPSIARALARNAGFSQGFPITDVEDANNLGQHYFGPVVLLTSGMTYSAGDIFAAGFADNNVGVVIGVDETTGGGGANCWFYNELAARLLGVPELSNGMNLQVAARECTRVEPPARRIEDSGVEPTFRYHLTEHDVLAPRPWGLLLHAALELSGRPWYDLEVRAHEQGNGRTLDVHTDHIDRLEFQVNAATESVKVTGRVTPLAIPDTGRVDLEIRGFDGRKMVARYVRVFRD